jgi:Tol biopolymer transport system component
VYTDGARVPLPIDLHICDASPQGNWLVATDMSEGRGGCALYLVRPDGTDRQLLSHANGWNVSARFSPDGRQVLYTHHDGKEATDPQARETLWVVDVVTKSRRPVVSDPRVAVRGCWAPDGTRLALVMWDWQADETTSNHRIEVLTLNGAKRQRILAMPPQAFWMNSEPDWTLGGGTEDKRVPDPAEHEAGERDLEAQLICVAPDSPNLDQPVTEFSRPEEITFAVKLTNTSNQTIKLLGTNYGDSFAPPAPGKPNAEGYGPFLFEFDFTDRAGAPIDRPTRAFLDKMLMMSGMSVHTVEPGKSHVVVLRPAKFQHAMEYRLAPGTYRARVRYRGPSDVVLEAIKKHWPDHPQGSVWSGEVQSGEAVFTVAGAVPPRTDLVWGDSKDGLRAAIEFIPRPGGKAPANETGEPPSFPHGTKLDVQLHIQNVSDRVIQFVSETWRQEDEVTVTDEAGSTQKLARRWYSGWPIMVRWTLQPGQAAQLPAANIGIAADDESAAKFEHPIGKVFIAKPGRYTARCEIRFGNIQQKDRDGNVVIPGKDDWQGGLETGATPFLIRSPQPGDAVLEPAKTFTGLVEFRSENSSTRPIVSGVWDVKEQNANYRPVATGQVKSGPIEVPECPTGPLVVSVRVPGYEETIFYDVTLKPDEPTSLTLVPAVPAQFRLVSSIDGSPIVGATVRYFNRSASKASGGPYPMQGIEGPIWAVSGPDGTVVLDSLQQKHPQGERLGASVYWFYVESPDKGPVFVGPVKAGDDLGDILVAPLLEVHGEVRGTKDELASFSAEWDQPAEMKTDNPDATWLYAISRELPVTRENDKLVFRLSGLRSGRFRIISRFGQGIKPVSHTYSRRDPNEDDIVLDIELTQSTSGIVISARGAAAPVQTGGESRRTSPVALHGQLVLTAALRTAGEPNRFEQSLITVDPNSGAWTRLLNLNSEGNSGFTFPLSSTRISPDGQSILFVRGDEVWRQATFARDSLVRVAAKGQPKAWDPTGNAFVIAVDNGTSRSTIENWLVRADGSTRSKLALTPGDVVQDWSKEGQWLAVQSEDGQLYLVKPNGTARRRITAPGSGLNEHARFSPDGRQLVYLQRDLETGRHSLRTVNVDGTGDRELLAEIPADTTPATKPWTAPMGANWSPDGRHLAVVLFDRSQRETVMAINGNWRLAIMDADGANRRELTLQDTLGLVLPFEGPDWKLLAVDASARPQQGATARPRAEPIVEVDQSLTSDTDWGAERDGLRTRLVLTTQEPAVGLPLSLRLELKNVSNAVRYYDPQVAAPFRIVGVQKANGEPEPLIGPTYQTLGRSTPISPGQVVVLWSDWNAADHFLFQEPGKYSIQTRAAQPPTPAPLGGQPSQSAIPSSNVVTVELAAGQLPEPKATFTGVRELAPKGWKASLSSNGIFFMHSPTNLKEDITSIRLWFDEKQHPAGYSLGEGSNKVPVEQLGRTPAGFAYLAAPARAAELWPGYGEIIRAQLQRSRGETALIIRLYSDKSGDWTGLRFNDDSKRPRMDRLEQGLKEHITGSPANATVQIEADQRLKYETVERVLDAVKRFGVTRTQIKTLPPPRGEGSSSVRIRVVEGAGRPVESAYINLWLRVGPDDKPLGERWREGDVVWERTRSWYPGYPKPATGLGFDEVAAGEYRVTVMHYATGSAADPTPAGASDPFQVAERASAEVTVTVTGSASLLVRVVDSETRQPVQAATLRLFRGDGMPIVGAARGNGNFFDTPNDQGELRYKSLTPGTYRVEALGQRATLFHPMDYSSPPVMSSDVKDGSDNIVEVPLKATPLTEQQLDERWPFSVRGIVRDGNGNPMAGVEMRAHTGIGTLMLTGTALTGSDGRYVLRFGPGMALMRGGRSTVGLQAATISAHRQGYFEKDLGRHGNLAMSDERPEPDDFKGFADVVLPGQPKQLDFVMVSAVRAAGTLVDADGKPLGGYRMSLTGELLPPSSGVLKSGTTDSAGRFEFRDIPDGPYKFQILVEPPKAEPPWLAWATPPLQFLNPGSRSLAVNVDQSTFRADRFQIQLVNSGVNWRTALSNAANSKIDYRGDDIRVQKEDDRTQVDASLLQFRINSRPQ